MSTDYIWKIATEIIIYYHDKYFNKNVLCVFSWSQFDPVIIRNKCTSLAWISLHS